MNIEAINQQLNKILNKLGIVTFLLILTIVVCFLIYDRTENIFLRNEIEEFTNKLRNENIEYLKFRETHLSTNNQDYNKLYDGYSGDGKGQAVWSNMTLNQCVDRCNKMDNCIGFNRENINDTEKGDCEPLNLEGKCHSSRKGNFDQRQNAIQKNLFYKKRSDDKVNDLINRCIGDIDMTLDRNILIKSYAFPQRHIGCKKNDVKLFGNELSKFLKLTACKFKVSSGLEGTGTVSFKHLHSDKYLFRDSNDNIVCSKVDMNSTDEKIRSSFYLFDGLSNQITIVCAKLRGEKNTDKVIVSSSNGNNLRVVKMDEIKNRELATFDIVDMLTNITVIGKRKNISKTQMENVVEEGFTNQGNDEFNDIDRMELYQYIDSGLTQSDFKKEYNENTNNNQINVGKFKTLSSIDSAFDKILDMPTQDDYGESMFLQTVKFNNHLYNADNGLRDRLKGGKRRIEKCIDELEKLMIQDVARDYNFLKK